MAVATAANSCEWFLTARVARAAVEKRSHFLREMAGATGLEPATFGVTGRHSNQLSYAPASVSDRIHAKGADVRGRPCPVKELGAYCGADHRHPVVRRHRHPVVHRHRRAGRRDVHCPAPAAGHQPHPAWLASGPVPWASACRHHCGPAGRTANRVPLKIPYSRYSHPGSNPAAGVAVAWSASMRFWLMAATWSGSRQPLWSVS